MCRSQVAQVWRQNAAHWKAVVDLDRLGLDEIHLEESRVRVGAAAKVQDLLDQGSDLPRDLQKACRLEAAWNMRNMATFGGTIMSAGARSPLLVVLLALGTQVSVHGGQSARSLDEILNSRAQIERPFLIEEIAFDLPHALSYEYVARAPADRPLVSAAAGLISPDSDLLVAIGGFGERPRLLDASAASSASEWRQLAVEVYRDAGDAFASAEYRSEIAGVLVERVVMEVQN